MKKLCLLLLLGFSIFFSNGQTVMTLKSGEVLKVKIVSSDEHGIVYTVLGDSINQTNVVSLDDIKEMHDLNQQPKINESVNGQLFTSPDPTFENQSKVWEFSEVVKVDSIITKIQLYNAGLDWFGKNFLSPKDVLQISDKEQGKLYGRGSIILSEDDGEVFFSISIFCKDGRYKYSLDNFYHKNAWSLSLLGIRAINATLFDYGYLTNEKPIVGWDITGRSKKYYDSMRDRTKKAIYYLILSLKSAMSNQSIKKEDNW